MTDLSILTVQEPGSVDAGLLLLRLVVGVTFSLHGFQKLFGWFGGGGHAATARWFSSLGFGDGRAAALLAGASEIAGGLGLALGLFTPLASLALIGTMTTAALVNRAAKGFWSADNGWELNLYLITVGGALAVTGPGAWSLDAALGYPVPSGPLPGMLAIGTGVVLGWARWATRDRSRP